MSEISSDPAGEAIPDGARTGAALIADWLGLAAAPSFALMALLTGSLGAGRMATICTAAPDLSPLDGMIPMYLLMSAVHCGPWLKLVVNRRRA